MSSSSSASSDEEVIKQVQGLGKSLVGFWAPWERGSRALVGKVIGAMASDPETFGDLTAIPLDVSKYEDAAFELGVMSLPFFGLYRYGHPVTGLSSTDVNDVLDAARLFTTSMDTDGEAAGPTQPPATATKAASSSSAVHRPATDLREPFDVVQRIPSGQPVRIFVAGDRSKVGKSSVCLGILGGLLKIGFEPADLAYIKPATQCESAQLVTKWCDSMGVENRGLGPVIFYKGFTREFLKGNVGSSQDLLQDVDRAVKEIGQGKKVILVDGVGYPAVGSICGISNADIVGVLGCPVVIVGRAGVGDAVDSFNLNACFFTSRGLRVLGGIFNRLPLEGFYSLDACKAAVSAYFSQYQPGVTPYGFLPERPELLTVREEIEAEHKAGGKNDSGKPAVDPDIKRIELAEGFISMFLEYVDLKRLVRDAYNYEQQRKQPPPSGSSSSLQSPTAVPTRLPAAPSAPSTSFSVAPAPSLLPTPYGRAPSTGVKRKSREEIESAAKKQGAKGG